MFSSSYNYNYHNGTEELGILARQDKLVEIIEEMKENNIWFDLFIFERN